MTVDTLCHPGPNSDVTATIAGWRDSIPVILTTLRVMAGQTEDEFLQVGAQLQGFYLRSSDITAMANDLVALVSGVEVQSLIAQLRHVLEETETYLAGTRKRGNEVSVAMNGICRQLEGLAEPLEGFQKMTKVLRMLGISTKIESSRIGEQGSGFLTLAQDVEKLSALVCDRSASILGHRQVLDHLMRDDLEKVRTIGAVLEEELSSVTAGASHSVADLVSLNMQCSDFGTLVSSISDEVSAAIGEVVTSLQMHDMTRQQIEHVIEALERLAGNLDGCGGQPEAAETRRGAAGETGDVCELQSALLRHASAELCDAVQTVLNGLRNIAGKQSRLVAEALGMTKTEGGDENSVMGAICSGMETVKSVLTKSAESDREMSVALSHAADKMGEVRDLVSDIEQIGSEIDLIALNAQVKAAHTGLEGAALGVLAEAIKRLSVDAVARTEAIAEILSRITESTEFLQQEATVQMNQLGARIAAMEGELSRILDALTTDNVRVVNLLSDLSLAAGQLNSDIEQAISGMDVQGRFNAMADEVLACLDQIHAAARDIEPATSEFRNNLQHMEERYTMESERRIHEAIARKRNGHGSPEPHPDLYAQAQAVPASEFGDNVDLF